jgi:CrcB protein
MTQIVLVFIGGGLGAVMRYGLGRLSAQFWPNLSWPLSEWPVATFLANIIGGLMMGVLMGLLLGPLKDSVEVMRLRLFFGVGILGGFTTFSAFSLEVIQMIERRAYGMAAAYVILSVVLSVFAVGLGLMAVKRGLSL